MIRPLAGLALVAALAVAEDADQTRFAVSFGEEASYAGGLRVPGTRFSNLLLAQPSFTWRRGERWRFAASLAAVGTTHGETHGQLRVKEAWAGFTAGDFDFSVGKKILKWGTGYAFTPTGVLDPPRAATDPTDRLNLNEGREMVEAEWVRGRHAVTAAWASAGLFGHHPEVRDTVAVRYNALLAGFDTAVVFARDRGCPNTYGVNFTRVVGKALEIHGEFAHREGDAVLAGVKYTLRSGVTAIAEFYSPPAPRRGRYVFLNVAKSRLRELPGWKHWDVGVSLLANTSDGSRIAILDVTRRLRDNFSFTARAQTPGGKRGQSEYGMIPYSALLSIGFRCQI